MSAFGLAGGVGCRSDAPPTELEEPAGGVGRRWKEATRPPSRARASAHEAGRRPGKGSKWERFTIRRRRLSASSARSSSEWPIKPARSIASLSSLASKSQSFPPSPLPSSVRASAADEGSVTASNERESMVGKGDAGGAGGGGVVDAEGDGENMLEKVGPPRAKGGGGDDGRAVAVGKAPKRCVSASATMRATSAADSPEDGGGVAAVGAGAGAGARATTASVGARATRAPSWSIDTAKPALRMSSLLSRTQPASAAPIASRTPRAATRMACAAAFAAVCVANAVGSVDEQATTVVARTADRGSTAVASPMTPARKRA